MGRETAAGVLVADGDARHRRLLGEILRTGGYGVHSVATGPDAIAAAASRPSLVLIEVDLPGLSGYEVCRRLRESFGYSFPIALMSGTRVGPLDRTAGLLLGADDYLCKPLDAEELLALAHARTRVAKEASSATAKLTGRQLEVLRLLGEGLDQREIADRLIISRRTVGAHIEQILIKLGARSRAQAVAYAYREGLLGATGAQVPASGPAQKAAPPTR